LFQLPNAELIQFLLMREEFARFSDNCRVSVERRVRFASRFHSGVVLRRHVGDSNPLRLAVHPVERLIAGIGKRKETISPFLDRRFRRGEGE
jgi:hypothetical protein